MKLPKKINPCPIVESIVEIRFQPSVPPDAVFGLIFKEVKNLFKDVRKLPILDIPEPIRRHDKNLINRPHHKLKNENYDLNIGPRIISLIKKEPYVGWDNFSRDIINLLNQVSDVGVIESIDRLGIRYRNFFDLDIFNRVNLKLLLGEKNFIKEDTYIKNTFEESGIKIVLQLGNKVNYNKDGNKKTGSLLDVDVSKTNLNISFLSNPTNILNEMHDKEKEVFFNILQDKFINQLNPEY